MCPLLKSDDRLYINSNFFKFSQWLLLFNHHLSVAALTMFCTQGVQYYLSTFFFRIYTLISPGTEMNIAQYLKSTVC